MAETLLKSEPQYLYRNYWSLWKQLRLKKSLWVIWKILGLFVNLLTADDKYSLRNRGNLLQHFQVHLSQKRKQFSILLLFFFFFFFFLHFLNLDSNSNVFKKRWPSQLIDFWTYGLWKTWLHKCLKSSVWENPSASNMVNRQKHCSKLKNRTFTKFIDPC